ncbi:HPF/RaiA family ribosome-associated protein [Candidatus Woesebacteria bacterium]|jgi:ribosomal subunit interface protein|nr:HPF/RaiA family ribosome-associated protein [Candidatus Woesebacteria bacterium]
MTVLVESKKMKVTQAIRLFAQKQASKVSKLGKSVLGIRIHLEKISKKKMDKNSNIVTYFLDVPGKNIVVKSKSTNMYDAIVEATTSAVRKLRKVNEKRKTIKRSHEKVSLTS